MFSLHDDNFDFEVSMPLCSSNTVRHEYFSFFFIVQCLCIYLLQLYYEQFSALSQVNNGTTMALVCGIISTRVTLLPDFIVTLFCHHSDKKKLTTSSDVITQAVLLL